VEDRYAAVITGPGAAPVLVDLGAAAPIDGAVRTWRADVFRGEHSEKSWQTIAATLWKPLVPALPKRTARVWLSPDGELARIPWHLLPTTDRATRHILVSQCDSAREVAALSSPQKGAGTARPVLFLAGGVDFDAGAAAPGVRRGGEFEKLPGTAGEIARLRALAEKGGFDVAVASGSDASKERVRMELQKAAFAHLATHGFFFQERPAPSSRGRDTEPDASARRTAGRNPLVESGIALAGANLRDVTTQEAKGLLTAEELVGLDLSHCQLVTLSACDTGRGEEVTGQGVMGLRAACLAAGARSMVMSLWTVPDESTAKLMQAFYANLWEKKLPRVEALRRAQESVRDDPSGSFREPIHWAGWVLAGEGW
jgi:CHAT domain-containing protein